MHKSRYCKESVDKGKESADAAEQDHGEGESGMEETTVIGRDLVGTEFFVEGSWWKGATHLQRKRLYPAKCVAYDDAHTFVTRKRKDAVNIETKASAIKFELTRPQDQAWNTGELWMMMSHYTEFAQKYDAEPETKLEKILSQASEYSSEGVGKAPAKRRSLPPAPLKSSVLCSSASDAAGARQKSTPEKEEKALEEGDDSYVCATCNKTFTSQQAPCFLLEGLHFAWRA
jgi:hypothetical protein